MLRTESKMELISVSIVSSYIIRYLYFVLFIIVAGTERIPTFINHIAHVVIILYYTSLTFEQKKPVEVLLDIPFCAL